MTEDKQADEQQQQADTPENVQKPATTEELRQTAEEEPVAPFQPNPNPLPSNTVANPPQPPAYEVDEEGNVEVDDTSADEEEAEEESK